MNGVIDKSKLLETIKNLEQLNKTNAKNLLIPSSKEFTETPISGLELSKNISNTGKETFSSTEEFENPQRKNKVITITKTEKGEIINGSRIIINKKNFSNGLEINENSLNTNNGSPEMGLELNRHNTPPSTLENEHGLEIVRVTKPDLIETTTLKLEIPTEDENGISESEIEILRQTTLNINNNYTTTRAQTISTLSNTVTELPSSITTSKTIDVQLNKSTTVLLVTKSSTSSLFENVTDLSTAKTSIFTTVSTQEPLNETTSIIEVL